MALVVGCPIQDRAWIMPAWFDHVERQSSAIQPHYVFVGDPRTDPDTFREIDRLCLAYGRDRDVVEIDEDFRPYKRVWSTPRLAHMTDLRNVLISHVRKLEPEVFWSLDSDILVHPETFESAHDLLVVGAYDAVGTKCFMTDKKSAPSFAQLSGPAGSLRRNDSKGQFKVDVIMASKLMSPKAYNVDYVFSTQGEDIGWSIAARKAGCRLGWDGSVCSKHVMERKNLDVVDERCGF